jgi:hypothetical protein
MASHDFLKILKGLRLPNKAATETSAMGELDVLTSSGKLQYHNGTTSSSVVTEDHTATMTLKTLISPVIHEIVTTSNNNITLNPNGTGKVVTDNLALSGNTLETTNANGDLTLAPNGTGKVLIGNLAISANSLISTNTNGDINLSPNGTGTVVINTDLDVDNLNLNGNTIISTNTDGNITITPNGTGNISLKGILTVKPDGQLNLTPLSSDPSNPADGDMYYNTTTDAIRYYDGNASLWRELRASDNLRIASDSSTGNVDALATTAKDIIRLIGAAPVLRGVTNGTSGKTVILMNASGADFNVNNDDAAATAADRILTGTGSTFNFKQDSCIILCYDDTTSRWRMVGGGGGGVTGTGTANRIPRFKSSSVIENSDLSYTSNTLTKETAGAFTILTKEQISTGLDSGSLSLFTGEDNRTFGTSGQVTISSGLASGTGTDSGNVYLKSGDGTGSGTSNTGAASILSGNSTNGNSGNIVIETGTAVNGTRGSVTVSGLGINLLNASGITIKDSGGTETGKLTDAYILPSGNTSGLAFRASGANGAALVATTASAPIRVETANTTSSTTGAISLLTGSGSSATSATGAVSVKSGAQTTLNSATGAITVSSGDNNGTGTSPSGAVTVSSGTVVGSTASGIVTLKSGDTAGVASTGTVLVSTGGSSGNATTGNLSLTTGATAGAGTSGDVLVTTGSTVGGTKGTIQLHGIAYPSSGTAAGAVVRCNVTTPTTLEFGYAGQVSKVTSFSSGPQTLDGTHDVVLCTNTFTLNLPTAAALTGRTYRIKNNGTGVITITPGSGNIDGAATYAMSTQYESISVVSDGSNWFIL